MIKIGALWENKSKKGNKYFSGSFDDDSAMGKTKFFIFKNTQKKQETHPDWMIYIEGEEEKKDGDIPF